MGYKQDRFYYKNLDQTIEEVLDLLTSLVPLNSFYVATNDRHTNYIIKARNRVKELVEENSDSDYNDTPCRLAIENGTTPLVVEDLKKSPLTKNKSFTQKLNGGSYVGVPILLNDKEVFGTLCAIDDKPFKFTPEQISLIKNFGHLLSQVVSLEERTIRDSLTGLYNRDFVRMYFDRESREENLAVFFIKFNRFKRINEVFGHTKGDQVIQIMADRLKRGIGHQDVIARFSGDKFLIIVKEEPGRSLKREVPRLGNHLLSLVKEPFFLDDQEIQLQANIGISFYPEEGATLDSLLKNAESSLELAKEQGGNTLGYYQPFVIKALLSELQTENELRRSLDEGNFKLFFQPQIDFTTGELKGFETLVRWHHPKRGIVLPNDFISVAEASGMIFPLGEWVFKKACQVKQDWDQRHYPPVELGINLSPRQFQDPNLFNHFSQYIDEFKVDPSYLNLEITESLIMKDMEQSMYLLNQFKALGLGLSIDDFGKGYSSLALLRALPINTLKIDRAFVKDLGKSTDAEHIIKAIIGMAQALDLKIIAEGIETSEQDQMLRGYGCHWAQGYYYSRPIPEEDILFYFDQKIQSGHVKR